MKKLFLLFSFISSYACSAQRDFYHTFEAPNDTFANQFIIDTNFSTNNIWQIGQPQKSTFDSAYSLPNAILTDTLKPYPINDTSILLLRVQSFYSNSVGGNWHILSGLSFMYKLDIDSGEITKIEIATDTGKHWVDLLAEDTTYDIKWGLAKPDLSKSTNGWVKFNADFTQWAELQHSYPHQYSSGNGLTIGSVYTDSTFIRFTFISDSIQTNKDGWMMDNFRLDNLTESVETITNNNLISIFPNPARDYIYIKSNYSYYGKPEVSICNLHGQEVYSTEKVPKNGYLKVDLPDGMYLLKYSTGSEQAVKQLIIQH